MMHQPIILNNVSLHLAQRVCFENLNAQIHYGKRIGIIGRNGSGKSSLLKIIQKLMEPSHGQVITPPNIIFGYVPQILDTFEKLSGGQRFNEALTQALALNHNVLCLDEPTNNLDLSNRKSLLRMLAHCQKTLIIVSHDVELLRTNIDEIWHINEEKVFIFPGNYDAYQATQEAAWNTRLKQLEQLKKEKRKTRQALQFEQKRAAQSKHANKYENDKKLKGAMKQWGSKTRGKKSGHINALHHQIEQELKQSRLPEIIEPKFHLRNTDLTSSKALVSIANGSCGYNNNTVLEKINLQIGPCERIALVGDNGSGKSTLIKALLDDAHIHKTGIWLTPKKEEIGYLDQQYKTLDPMRSVFDTIKLVAPHWKTPEIRQHLNDFLFRKNEEVNALTSTLSGGEKARLSLAHIAAQNKRLLMLDEITNNLDLETKDHVIQVLNAYPGTIIVISHDEYFLKQINIATCYSIAQGRCTFMKTTP